MSWHFISKYIPSLELQKNPPKTRCVGETLMPKTTTKFKTALLVLRSRLQVTVEENLLSLQTKYEASISFSEGVVGNIIF